MGWVVIIALAITLLGGGTATVYAADSAAPGDTLYVVDRAVEALQLALTSDAGSRARLALAHAEERLLEAETLIARAAGEEEVRQAVEAYGESIRQAAQALAEVAASDEAARAEALAALLEAALSAHEQVLIRVAAQAPEEARPFLERVIEASRVGRTIEERTFGEGFPGRRSEQAPGGPSDEESGRPEEIPGGGPPKGVPSGPPGGVPAEGHEAGERGNLPAGLEGRIAALSHQVEAIVREADEGDAAGVAQALAAYQTEVATLAQTLAQVATQDEARAQALVALLEEALSQHSSVLNEVLARVPPESHGYIQRAITASEQVRQRVLDLFADGMPGGGGGEGVPAGPPSGGHP